MATNKGLRDVPRTHVTNDNYRDGWDAIFGKVQAPSAALEARVEEQREALITEYYKDRKRG